MSLASLVLASGVSLAVPLSDDRFEGLVETPFLVRSNVAAFARRSELEGVNDLRRLSIDGNSLEELFCFSPPDLWLDIGKNPAVGVNSTIELDEERFTRYDVDFGCEWIYHFHPRVNHFTSELGGSMFYVLNAFPQEGDMRHMFQYDKPNKVVSEFGVSTFVPRGLMKSDTVHTYLEAQRFLAQTIRENYVLCHIEAYWKHLAPEVYNAIVNGEREHDEETLSINALATALGVLQDLNRFETPEYVVTFEEHPDFTHDTCE